MAASGRKPKNCNDNNDTNPNFNWKSNALTFLSAACIAADEYLIPMFFPEEAMIAAAASTAYTVATVGANAAASAFGTISSMFRRKVAVKVNKSGDLEAGLLAADSDQKTVAQTGKGRLGGQLVAPAAVGLLAATFGNNIVQQAKLGGAAAMFTHVALQTYEAGRFMLFKAKGVDMITDDYASAPASPELGTPGTQRKQTK